MIILNNVSLSIPIFSSESTLLKRKIIKTVAGGSLYIDSSKIPRVEALSNINCIIKPGEIVALLGHNGSGKTSFLKIISGIYTPTEGLIKKNLKVFPMIQKSFITSEELSGYIAAKAFYMNVYNSEKGFLEYFESLKEFSGIGDFIYLPLKTYSQGMYSRLLFSILTSFNHECLALDEGFSAADDYFNIKAEKRMDLFIKNSGTLIFASHSKELLKRFCDRGLVFEKGKIVFDGNIDHAIANYDKNL